jgi:glutathione synthase/RimK-type ligase-like ATP-grasp enzyme
MILIVSAAADLHAAAVATELDRRGAAAIIADLSRFPRDGTLVMGFGVDPTERRLRLGHTAIDLNVVRAVWWRRPQPYGLRDDMVDAVALNFALHETHEAIEGLWLTLDAAWINDPARDTAAARKIWQLDVARSCGLTPPRTLVTNDPDAARAFAASQSGGVVYKAFQGSERAWRETRLLGEAEAAQLDAVVHAPVIFQECVEGADLRVTIVGDQIFPAEIVLRPGAYPLDFRMDIAGATIRPCSLPDAVTAGLRRLMARLGLVYGAVDFRRKPDGEHVFLEINPGGQWLFVEDQTGQPVSAALADALIRAAAGVGAPAQANRAA